MKVYHIYIYLAVIQNLNRVLQQLHSPVEHNEWLATLFQVDLLFLLESTLKWYDGGHRLLRTTPRTPPFQRVHLTISADTYDAFLADPPNLDDGPLVHPLEVDLLVLTLSA